MAKIIKEADFINPSALTKVADDVHRIAQEVINADKVIVEMARNMKNIKVPNMNVSELKETEKTIAKVNKMYEDKAKIDRENVRILQEQEKLRGIQETNERRRAKEAERVAKQQEIANNKKLKAEKELNSAYQQTQKRASELYQKLRDLAIVGDTNSKAYRKLKTEYDQLDKSLKNVDATFGKHQRNVGNYPTAINGITSGLSKLGIAFSGVALAREITELFTGFEDATASFRTIVSDLNDVEFSKFESKIKTVADDTKSAMTDVANSFETIAGLNAEFAETADGLGQVSEAAITLSKASKDGLQPSAENLVSIMNQFSLEANQADRAINVLAAGQAVGAASITQLAESYKNVGAVASGANLDIEDTTALLEVLGKFSLFGAEAGTKLRGSILQLQKANLGYASGQFNMNDALAEYNKNAEKFTTEAEKNAYATKIFGAENITAGRILSDNVGLIDEFTKKVTGTNEALRAADINTNTLTSAWNEFTNVLSNMVTGAGGVENAFGGITKALRFLTNNLPTIVSWLGKLVVVWGTWKTVIFSMKMAERLREIGGLSGAFNQMTTSVKGATTQVSAMGNAFKAIGWTALISVVAQVALKFYDIASGADEARRRSNDFYKAQKKGAKDVSEFLKGLQANRDEESSALLASGGNINKGVADINKKYDALIKAEIKALNKRKDEVKLALLNFNEANEKELAKNPMLRNQFVNIKDRTFRAEIYEINEELKALISELGGVEAPYNKLVEANNKVAESATNSKEKLQDWTKAVRDLSTTQLSEYSKLEREIFNKYQDDLEKIQDTDIKAKEYRIELEKQYYRDLEKIRDDFEKKRLEQIRASRETSFDFENMAIGANSQVSNLDRLQEYYNKRQEIIEKYGDNKEKIDEEFAKLEFENNQKSLESTIIFAQQRIEAIRKIYEELLGTDDELLSEADLKAKQEFEKQINDYQSEILQADIELQNQRLEANKKIADSTKDFWKITTDFIKDVLEAIQATINKIYDSQISSENRLIDKSRQRVDQLNQMYAVGNQKATESILAQEKEQERALRRIEEIEKRRAKMQLFTSILGAAGNALGGIGSGQSAMSQANAFINSLPKFESGTEYFSTSGSGLDGRGGAPAILHNKERVMTAEQNALAGFTTPNMYVAESAYLRRTGQLVDRDAIGSPMDLIKPLTDEIKEGFKNITSVNTNIDSIIDGVLKVTTTKRQGRVTIIDQKKYKA